MASIELCDLELEARINGSVDGEDDSDGGLFAFRPNGGFRQFFPVVVLGGVNLLAAALAGWR